MKVSAPPENRQADHMSSSSVTRAREALDQRLREIRKDSSSPRSPSRASAPGARGPGARTTCPRTSTATRCASTATRRTATTTTLRPTAPTPTRGSDDDHPHPDAAPGHVFTGTPEEIIGDIIGRFERPVAAFIASRLVHRDRQLVEDLTQDTFVQLWRYHVAKGTVIDERVFGLLCRVREAPGTAGSSPSPPPWPSSPY